MKSPANPFAAVASQAHVTDFNRPPWRFETLADVVNVVPCVDKLKKVAGRNAVVISIRVSANSLRRN